MDHPDMMEPSEEFPILFGLLTESNKKNNMLPITSMGETEQNWLRRVIPASISTIEERSIVVEPDSSTSTSTSSEIENIIFTTTTDRNRNRNTTITNTAQGSSSSNFQFQPHHSTTSASPLLILRLTSNSNSYGTEVINRQQQNITTRMLNCSRRRPRQELSFTHYQELCRNFNRKVISNEDDCTPSSTTDDEACPNKRFRMYEQEPSEEPEMPLLDSIVSSSPSNNNNNNDNNNFPDRGNKNNPSSTTLPGFSLPPPKLISFTSRSGPPGQSISINSSDSSQSSQQISNHKPQQLPSSQYSSPSVFFNCNEDDRPYTCTHCDLKFKRQFSLLRHVATHEVTRDFRCCHCSTAFYRKDNLLVHQKNCEEMNKYYSKRQIIIKSNIERPRRQPPRSMADLLDQDDYNGKYGKKSYVQLPGGLEISEVQVPLISKMSTRNTVSLSNCDNKYSSPCPSIDSRRYVTETINLIVDSDEESSSLLTTMKGNDVEVYPCGHCNKIFETFSRLLKHTAAKHIKNPTDGTFHFEIETMND